MTNNTIGALIIGIIFSLIGIFVCIHFKWRKAIGYISLLMGLSLVYISTIGPLSNGKKIINELKNLEGDEVESIIIQPTTYYSSENISLVHFDNTITNREIIKGFCTALKTAVNGDEDYLKNIPKSACRVQINMADKKTIVFGVKKSGQATCLTIDSNGETGWHYGNLKALDFGVWLDNYVKNDRTKL